jgi:azurin
MTTRRFFSLLASAALLPLAASAAPTTVNIGTLPGLRYDLKRFEVRPGAEVKLVFSNTDTMLHNLLICRPGSRLAVVKAAEALGAEAAEKDYVPDSPDVLWSIPVVASGESETLRFTAPAEAGEYPYVCTYPGHGLIMHGVMGVTENPGEPVPNRDEATEMADHADHGHRAVVRRSFMPDVGPAAIAVKLPGGHSYCWDAGACCFRYAWTGGFVTPVYRKPDQIDGEIYVREDHRFPLRIGDESPERPETVQFLGYRLDDSGAPEFEYVMDGIVIKEFLTVRAGALVRRFRTTAASDQSLAYFFNPATTARIDATGERKDDHFVFRGEDAREFFITIKPSPDSED